MMRRSLSPLVVLAGMLALVPTAQADVRLRTASCPFESDVSFKVLGAKDNIEGVQAEYKWMQMERPGWRRTDQLLMSHEGRDYDLLSITNGRQSEVICFDITDFFGKMPQ